MPVDGKLRRLLVEGKTEQFTIPELIEHNGTNWGDFQQNTHIVDIYETDGIQKLLKPETISVHAKVSHMYALGLIVDADDDLNARWEQVKSVCKRAFPNIPKDLPATGLILDNSTPRFGVWIMPDNQTSGMMETFLTFLTDTNDPLYQHASQYVDDAKTHNAPYKPSHRDKALIHSWLAVQDEPGNQLHIAVKKKILDAQSEYAENFVKWFRELYQV